ncbi:PREDICTED: F-box/LRR-repeat protein 13-like [Fragaria vesca subsp. vesca]
MVEISQLNDDLLGQILKRVNDPDDRKRFSQVCKQWSTVEGLTITSLTLFRLSSIRQVLPRFPNLVTFRTSQPISEEADLEFIAQTCPKLEAINLSTTDFESSLLPKNGLYGLSSGGGLLKLSKVLIRGRENVGIHRWLPKLAHENLTYLDLGRCSLVDDKALKAIGLLCPCLSYLNLEVSDVSDKGLRLLAHARCSKTLKTLVLAQCYYITDSGVSYLQSMQCLEELDLENCGEHDTEVSDIGVRAAISGNRSLKKLNLSWLINVSDQIMVFVSENCPNLEFLDVSHSSVTVAGIRALSGHRCLESLVWRTDREYFWWPDIDASHSSLDLSS